LGAASALVGWPKVAHAEPSKGIYLLPLGGGVPSVDIELVRVALGAVYSEDVRTLARTELPRSAFYAQRSRYRAEKLLDFLRPLLPAGGLRIAGITAADISTTKGAVADWGILGLASIDGTVCVFSTFRCRRRLRGAEQARVRFAKTAVHEIGHTFGLDHCPNRGCIMEDGGGSVLTTDRERDLCPTCRGRLAERKLLREPPGALPW
jgi:archaemetzincin